MKIFALVPDDSRHVLERSLKGQQKLTDAGGVRAAAAAIREGRCDAIVLDPAMLDSDEFEGVLAAIHKNRVPLMLYTSLGAVAARRVLRAVDGAAHELVLRGSDDAPELLQRKLAALVAPSAPAILLSHAASHFRSFPDKLQTVSVSLFGRTTLPRWVNGLVKESGFARRTVDRWMHNGGISGAARLLDTARLARVWEPLVERNMTEDEVARRYGYSRVRLLTAHARRITGVLPRELKSNYTRETFSARLAAALTD
jgi:hypothetical protein